MQIITKTNAKYAILASPVYNYFLCFKYSIQPTLYASYCVINFKVLAANRKIRPPLEYCLPVRCKYCPSVSKIRLFYT